MIRKLSQFIKEKAAAMLPKPQLGEFRSGYRDDYDTSSSLLNLTPAKLSTAIIEANEGNTRDLYEIFEHVEHDPHVGACLVKRRLPIKARKFNILPYHTGDQQSEDIAEFCREVIDGIGTWRQTIYDLTDAIAKGFSAHQIVWKLSGNRWVIDRLVHWPCVNFRFGDPSADLYSQRDNDLRVLTDSETFRGVPIDSMPGQWVVHFSSPFTAPRARSQLSRGIVWYNCFKRWSVKDWWIFAERYGMPARLGKYPMGATDGERKALWNAVKRFGRDFAAIVPEGSMIELIQAASTASGSTLPYPELIKLCDDGVSKLLLGSPMALEPGNKGARSLGEVYERGLEEYTDDDCLTLAETIRRDILTPLVYFNFGPDAPIPYCEFQAKQNKNLNEQANRDVKLITAFNLEVDREYIHTEYGIPRSESSGDDLLMPRGATTNEQSGFDADDVQLTSKKKSQDWLILNQLSQRQSSDLKALLKRYGKN